MQGRNVHYPSEGNIMSVVAQILRFRELEWKNRKENLGTIIPEDRIFPSFASEQALLGYLQRDISLMSGLFPNQTYEPSFIPTRLFVNDSIPNNTHLPGNDAYSMWTGKRIAAYTSMIINGKFNLNELSDLQDHSLKDESNLVRALYPHHNYNKIMTQNTRAFNTAMNSYELKAAQYQMRQGNSLLV